MLVVHVYVITTDPVGEVVVFVYVMTMTDPYGEVGKFYQSL